MLWRYAANGQFAPRTGVFAARVTGKAYLEVKQAVRENGRVVYVRKLGRIAPGSTVIR